MFNTNLNPNQLAVGVSGASREHAKQITSDVMDRVRQNLQAMKLMAGVPEGQILKTIPRQNQDREQLADYVDLTGNIPDSATLDSLGYGGMLGDMAGKPTFATQIKLAELEQAAAKAARGGSSGTKSEKGFTPWQTYEIMKDSRDYKLKQDQSVRDRALAMAKSDPRLGIPDENATNTLTQLEDAYYLQLLGQQGQGQGQQEDPMVALVRALGGGS